MHRMRSIGLQRRTPHGRMLGFSLPELLVVIGVMMLLLAIIATPLRRAHRQALGTRCRVQLQQIGIALESCVTEHGYYPIWDDAGSPKRYTFVDVLVERGLLGNVQAAYCPEDPRPGSANVDRGRHFNVLYPGQRAITGIDYSYGIGVPLASGARSWNANFPLPGDPPGRNRQLEHHDRHTAQRVLAADANWSSIYNLSGDALLGRPWSYPTQYDNTVAWRHGTNAANILYQDGHVMQRSFVLAAAEPINTSQTCVWYPGEPVNVGPEYFHGDNYYPCAPPVSMAGNFNASVVPREMIPRYYTTNLLWTQISHK